MGMSPSFQISPAQQQARSSTQAGPMSLGTFMAAIRRLESGSFAGNYNATGRMVRGDHAVGAYQIMSRYWDTWAAEAGIPGANWRNPQAQDRVAAHRMQRYFEAFGDWDLVALAWYAGTGSVRTVLERGYDGPGSIQNPHIRQYVQEIRGYSEEASRQEWTAPRLEGNLGVVQGASGWLFPVAGEADWGRGSWMPDTKTHRGRTHAAIDVYAAAGTPIVAPVGGRIKSVRSGNIGGNTVQIEGDDGTTYYFAHMRDTAVVQQGQRINAGQHLGFVGNSGTASSTSPHLHMSMRRSSDNSPINPSSYLEAATKSDQFSGLDPQQTGGPRQGAVSSVLDNVLSNLSNQIAGGQRDPTAYEVDPAGTESAEMEAEELMP